jgi:oxygen-independent coproporphyrinogen-3 oxidase
MDIPETLLRRLDVPGPRYTSYPTADRFVEAFGPAEYAQALRQRADGAMVGGVAPLSIYVHIPFCEQVCYYCACNKVITKHHERGREYLDALAREIQLHVDVIGRGKSVSQLHFGGGSPTFLSDEELGGLMDLLRREFKLAPGAEISIEVDPRTASPERLGHLAQMGFNRISFGVQDFDPDVQVAVHRIQSFESVRDLVAAARALNYESINADLIYGLPKQTPESFARTISQVTELRPDRIALYAYAHLPGRFKPQRRIDAADLPPPEHRIRMLGSAIAGFIGHGYTYIGMDHFALPGDALAAAKRQGRLHRNFQGYSTQPDCDLIALGVSAIGRMGATYSQNAKTLPEYYDAVQRDDLVRRAVIMAIMCQGRLEFESIELAHLIKMRDYFATELASLQPMVEGGLVEMTDDAIQVTATGWFFVRGVAMAFDKHLQADKVRERFSRII